MYLAKANPFVFNSFTTELASVPNYVEQQTVLNLLGWETLKTQRMKAKAKMFNLKYFIYSMGPNYHKELFTFKKEILKIKYRLYVYRQSLTFVIYSLI